MYRVNSDLVQVKISTIHGMGCFAKENINPETVILEYEGEIIDELEAIRRSKCQLYVYGDYIFSLENGYYIDAALTQCKAKFVNHSCDPNLYVLRHENKIYFVTKRFIQKGEELTIDYAFPKEYSIKCNCGSENCRGYI